MKSAMEMTRNPEHKKHITSFDVDCQDRIICAGTEELFGDVYLLFWDIRACKMLGAYWYSHAEDVTQVLENAILRRKTCGKQKLNEEMETGRIFLNLFMTFCALFVYIEVKYFFRVIFIIYCNGKENLINFFFFFFFRIFWGINHFDQLEISWGLRRGMWSEFLLNMFIFVFTRFKNVFVI